MIKFLINKKQKNCTFTIWLQRQEDEEAMLKEAEQNQTAAKLITKKSPGSKRKSQKSGKGGRKVITREVEVEREGDGEEDQALLQSPETLPGTEGLGKIMTNFHRFLSIIFMFLGSKWSVILLMSVHRCFLFI